MNALPIAPGTIEAFGLYLARCAALVVGLPLFGAPTGFMVWRVALIVLLSASLYASGGTPLATEAAPLEYGLFVLREVVIGLALAFCLHGALLVVRTAGEMVSHEIGLGFAGLVDPSTMNSTSAVALFYEVFFYLGLFLTDAHHVLFRALAASFDGAPVGVARVDVGLADAALTMVCQMLAAGLAFAAPILALLFATSLLVALLGRAVPQLNVNETGFTLRTVVGLLALFFFAPTMAPALNDAYAAMFERLQDVVSRVGA